MRATFAPCFVFLIVAGTTLDRALAQDFVLQPEGPFEVSVGQPFNGALARLESTSEQRGNNGFVAALYQDLLGRPIDVVGRQQLIGLLDAGQSRAQAAQAVLTSAEYRNRLVQELYHDLLGRDADPGELSGGRGLLMAGAMVEQYISTLAASPEYFAGHGGGSNGGFVTALYHDLLGRTPDAGALSQLQSQLDAGKPRGDVATAILSSSEYFQRLVSRFFQTYLGRAADAGAANGFVDSLRHGASRETVQAAILASPEYFAAHSGRLTAGGFAATIDWGDGAADAATLAPNASDGLDVLAMHTYRSVGSFVVHVSVVRAAGGQASVDVNFTTTSGIDLTRVLRQLCGAGIGGSALSTLTGLALMKKRRHRSMAAPRR